MANRWRFCGCEDISPFSSPSKEMAQFTRARHFDPQAHYQQRAVVFGEQRGGTHSRCLSSPCHEHPWPQAGGKGRTGGAASDTPLPEVGTEQKGSGA